jgi:hypothetical protein
MSSQLLTKSKYLAGLQCPKLLWVQFHEPERIPDTDAVTQYIFDQGHLVGELAKKLFPGSTDIPHDDFTANVNKTEELLKERIPLYEAGILSGEIYSRIDVLNPANENEWDIIEVKSSTFDKKVHIDDVSFQKYCCETHGLKIRKCFLALINNKYVKNGEIDPHGLFIIHDVTDRVIAVSEDIRDRIDTMLETVESTNCPEVSIGKYCREPYECPLVECWESLPEDSIFTLYYGGKKCFDLFSEGILTVKDIPDSYKMGEKQHIQRACVISGEPFVNKEGIREFISSLKYPLYFLDFETIGPAVPLFDGTRPYQDTPFQFSLHVINSEDAVPDHFSFLASGPDDPRPSVLTELKRLLGDTGSIVVYNQGFEEGILKELALAFPEHDNWVTQVCDRLVDLLTPFSNFHYYHPQQKGSASLKRVLPAITGQSYGGLEISEGQSASIAFQTITYGDVSEEEKQKVREDLIRYCGQDTEGMIWIVEKLRNLCQ